MPPPRTPAEAPLAGTSSFRVTVGKQEIGVCQVSALASQRAGASPEAGAAPPHDALATVTLRRALTGGTELFDWRRDATAQGDKAKRTVTIDLLAVPGGDPVASWRLDGALPVRWSGPALDALAHAVALEEVELAFDSVTWVVPGQQPDPKSPHTIPVPPPLTVAGTSVLGTLGTVPVKPARPTG